MMKIVGNEPRFGAYTELFAGLDPSVTAQDKYGEYPLPTPPSACKSIGANLSISHTLWK